MPRTLLYVAYPMRLDMGAANAIQTYSTVRELRRIVPGMRLVVPRWLREKSAFDDLDTLYLPRPAVNKLSKFVPWGGWSYIERTLYVGMLVTLLVVWRLTGRGWRVLYVRDAVCAAWLARLRVLHGARVIYEVHDLEAAHPSKASKWPGRFWSRFLPWLDRSALTRSYRLVSLTEAFKDWAVERRIRPASEIAVIPDAYDPDLYAPRSRNEVRRSLGLPSGVPIVGYAGLTFAYRNLDLLVEAFAELRTGHPDAVLLLVGGRADEVDGLRKLARQLALPEGSVILTGQVAQQRAALYLNAADVLVIPDTVTNMTASPLKLFEYMAVGKAIVCKELPALREILDNSSARFFEGDNRGSLVAALDSLLADEALRSRLGAAALSRAAQYTYRARAERIKRVVQG